MKQYLKFTFDVDQALQATRYYNYSSARLCDFDRTKLIMQFDIYKRMVKLFGTVDTIKQAYANGFCTPCALYNAFPFAFNCKLDNVAYTIYNNIDGDKFANVKYMTSLLNKINNAQLLHCTSTLTESYKIFELNVSKNKPILVTYQYSNTIPQYQKKQHSITLFGYDDNSIYYFENSDQNILFYSLACYIRDYLANFGNTLEISKDNLVKEYLTCSNEKRLIEIAKELLGYQKLDNGLTMLSKQFLTNGKVFYDVNQVVECTDDTKFKSYSETIAPGNIDSMALSLSNCNFSSLTKRLRNLS